MKLRKSMAKGLSALLLTTVLGSCADDPIPFDWAAEVILLADEFLAEKLLRTPEIAYFADLEIDRHDGLSDNSLEAVAAWDDWENDFLVRLVILKRVVRSQLLQQL